MDIDFDLGPADDADRTGMAPGMADETPSSPRALKRRKKYLFAAMRCIRRVGTQEATMDLIAAEAGVTRATIYREFNSRQGLLSAVTAYRFESFCARFFRRVDPDLPLADTLEIYFLASAGLALRNTVTRRLVRGSLDFTRPGSALHGVALQAWRPCLDRAHFKSSLETLDYEDIVQWILVAQFTLCRLMIDTQMPLPRLRRYIRNFVLPAFHGAPSNSDGPTFKMRGVR